MVAACLSRRWFASINCQYFSYTEYGPMPNICLRLRCVSASSRLFGPWSVTQPLPLLPQKLEGTLLLCWTLQCWLVRVWKAENHAN